MNQIQMEDDAGERSVFDVVLDLVRSGTPLTDILIQFGRSIHVKSPSGWIEIPDTEFSLEQISEFLNKCDNDWENKFAKLEPVSRSMDLADDRRLRVMGYNTDGGSRPSIAIRVQQKYPMTIQETGLSTHVATHMLSLTRGLLLVCGPTSTGKSTTVAAMVDYINSTRASHIITIEDPSEYTFVPNKSIFSTRQVGSDVSSFSEGVKWAMRQVPNVIMIGEILDEATAEAAFRAGESGHLVIATLHANSAPGAIEKLLSFFPSSQERSKRTSLQNTLIGVISQALLPRADKNGWVLAAELLFNHRGQLADKAGKMSAFELQDMLNNNDTMKRLDEISISMQSSVRKLIVSGAVDLADALQSISLGAEFALSLRPNR